MKQFFANLWSAVRDHPKTTAGAIAGLVASGVGAYHNPALLVSEEWWGVVFVAIALLAASDAKKQ